MINILDQNTIDKIAAGEVIERPMSVVKELVENSIDSKATRITIEITDGGKSMIRVTDNGTGITKDDVKKAFYSHATSKLTCANDLIGVMTLGFRGEALSTIAAVTDTELITKVHNSMTGIRYEIRGGKEICFEEIGAPDGTTIIARNLFFNTPARLKFLKTNMTEGSYISDLVCHIALSNPSISIQLISDGKTVLDTSGNGKLKDTIYQLFGKEITKSILEVNYNDSKINIKGYSGKPFLSKGNRSFENYFVNNRYIKNAVINKAIEEAYKTYVMQHRFPFTVLFIDLPPESVDVNVHPAKREFRFDDEKSLFYAIYHAVSQSLLHQELIPDADADYGQRQKLYTPVNNKMNDLKNETNIKFSDTKPASSEIDSTSSLINSESSKTDSGLSGINNDKSFIRNDHIKIFSSEHSNSETATENFNISKETVDKMKVLQSILPKEYLDKLKNTEVKNENEPSAGIEYQKNNTYINDIVNEEKSFAAERNNEYLQQDINETGYLKKEALKKHHIVGQIFKTYWITEYDGNLFIMDQHAAHEKINYENFLEEFKKRKIVSQQIYPSIIITLSSREKSAVMENITLFEKTGFEIEDFGDNDVKISSVPVNLVGLSGRDVFVEFAADISSGVKEINEDIFVHKIATMGCKAAIKGNQEISADEAQELISKLMTLKNPYTCPHGRPTIIKISKEELDKKFRRIVE